MKRWVALGVVTVVLMAAGAAYLFVVHRPHAKVASLQRALDETRDRVPTSWAIAPGLAEPTDRNLLPNAAAADALLDALGRPHALGPGESPDPFRLAAARSKRETLDELAQYARAREAVETDASVEQLEQLTRWLTLRVWTEERCLPQAVDAIRFAQAAQLIHRLGPATELDVLSTLEERIVSCAHASDERTLARAAQAFLALADTRYLSRRLVERLSENAQRSVVGVREQLDQDWLIGLESGFDDEVQWARGRIDSFSDAIGTNEPLDVRIRRSDDLNRELNDVLRNERWCRMELRLLAGAMFAIAERAEEVEALRDPHDDSPLRVVQASVVAGLEDPPPFDGRVSFAPRVSPDDLGDLVGTRLDLGGLDTTLLEETLIGGGAIPRELIRDEVQRHLDEVRFCYQRELVDVADMEGRVVMGWTIAPTGSVANVRVETSTLRNPGVHDCLKEEIATWTFQPPRGGGVVSVRYPFVFNVAR